MVTRGQDRHGGVREDRKDDRLGARKQAGRDDRTGQVEDDRPGATGREVRKALEDERAEQKTIPYTNRARLTDAKRVSLISRWLADNRPASEGGQARRRVGVRRRQRANLGKCRYPRNKA